MPANRVVIGSENDDTRKIELVRDVASGQVSLPVALFGADGQRMNLAGGLVPEKYDSITLAYSGTTLVAVIYKLAAATIATLSLTYDGSGNLTKVART